VKFVSLDKGNDDEKTVVFDANKRPILTKRAVRVSDAILRLLNGEEMYTIISAMALTLQSIKHDYTEHDTREVAVDTFDTAFMELCDASDIVIAKVRAEVARHD
jgi:hypothetical protein